MGDPSRRPSEGGHTESNQAERKQGPRSRGPAQKAPGFLKVQEGLKRTALDGPRSVCSIIEFHACCTLLKSCSKAII